MSEIEAMANAGAEGAKAGKAGLDLIGKVFSPMLTQRQAKADAQAEVQGALATRLAHYVESSPLDPNTLEMLADYDGKMSVANLASILSKALPMLNEDADPSLVSNDWIANWRDKARLVSDEEMATLWAQLLAGETNNPGSYSRKTVNVMADLATDDAHLFKNLSNFRLIPVDPDFKNTPNGHVEYAFKRAGSPQLAILDCKNPIYTDRKITYQSLSKLEWLGLLKHHDVEHIHIHDNEKFCAYEYGAGQLYLSSREPINFGCASFTPAGAELSDLCIPLESPNGFTDYITEFWRSKGVTVTNNIHEILYHRTKA